MQLHVIDTPCELGQRVYRLLMSDLHLGHPNADKALIKADLDHARRLNARVLLNGDVFDAINPRDKRFSIGGLDQALLTRNDLARSIVDLGVTTLEPYADLIDVIGVGNHEQSWLRQCQSDLVGLLIDRLNATLEKQGSAHRIRHGGIQGYIRTRFQVTSWKGKPKTVLHDLLYQHGAGGDAPVTQGSIDAYRRQHGFRYHCLTFGHKHNSMSGDNVELYVSRSNRIRQFRRLWIQTASYLWNYTRTGQDKPLAFSYAEEGHHSPKPLRGKVLVMMVERDVKRSEGKTWSEFRVEQGAIDPTLA